MPFKLSRTDLQELRWIAEDIDEDGGECNRTGSWKRICKRSAVYLDKERFLVLKRPNFIYNKRTPKKFRVPTIKVDEFGWVVQPYVDKTRTALAVKLLREKMGNLKTDLHHFNVGWYNGKPLMFDW